MLNKQEIYQIQRMVKEKRNMYSFGMGPLGENIFKLLREIGTQIIYLPVASDQKSNESFTAVYLRFHDHNETLSFVGLNTQQYYDDQIFALAHELYHHYEGEEWSVCRFTFDEDDHREYKASRFAAELLLPTEALEEEVKKENQGEVSLKTWDYLNLLRFVARLHCEYQLPYKAIIRRFQEIGIITENQFTELIREPVRDKTSRYYKIGSNICINKFESLNTRTCRSGVDGPALNDFIHNYQSGQITLMELIDDLKVFEKSLADFGIEEEVEPEDIEELNAFLGGAHEGKYKCTE